ncbi:glycine cleavage system protein H [Kerstersia sp.]|uniref:glycine cleavage system protein H n=1 Tax=Kerstersia sp. TaxID=1930783 RepID=UPI003F9338A6
MHIPDDRRYAATHEWILRDGDSCIVGISDPAQDQLGDVVYVGDVPVGQSLQAGQVAGVVESVKAASDIHAPVAGRVIEFNDTLAADPSGLNSDPYTTWIFRIVPDAIEDIDTLLDAAGYGAVASGS